MNAFKPTYALSIAIVGLIIHSECLVKDGAIHPIDFANACPDSNFTSLHTHFPWLLCALVKWISYVAVTKKNMGIDLEQEKYTKVFMNPKKSQQDKFDFHKQMSDKYFEIQKFQEFCDENYQDLDMRLLSMIIILIEL